MFFTVLSPVEDPSSTPRGYTDHTCQWGPSEPAKSTVQTPVSNHVPPTLPHRTLLNLSVLSPSVRPRPLSCFSDLLTSLLSTLHTAQTRPSLHCPKPCHGSPNALGRKPRPLFITFKALLMPLAPYLTAILHLPSQTPFVEECVPSPAPWPLYVPFALPKMHSYPCLAGSFSRKPSLAEAGITSGLPYTSPAQPLPEDTFASSIGL